MIGICGLCGRAVDPSSSPDDDDCAATYSGKHPRPDVEWYEIKRISAQPPDAWWCEGICGKAICRDIGVCWRSSPMAAEKWRKEADRIIEQRRIDNV